MKRRIVFLVLALILALSLCACGQQTADYEYPAAVEPEMAYDSVNSSFGAMRAAGEEAQMDTPAESKTTADSAENGVNIPAPQPEKIIYTANLNMETKEFDKTVSAFEASVLQYGGYTMYSDVSGDTSYAYDGTARVINRYASYSVCIPADKLDAFLSETCTLGNVTSNSKSAENVTSRYTDYTVRKNSLETEETRLLELLGQADSIDTLVALEKRLAEVRYEIESIQSNLNDLDRRLAYSTVNLYLQEVRDYRASAPVTQSFGDRLKDALGNGWDSFVEGLEDFTVGLAEAIIPLMIFAVIAIVVIVIIRKKVKKSRAKKAAKAAEAPAEKPADKPEA